MQVYMKKEDNKKEDNKKYYNMFVFMDKYWKQFCFLGMTNSHP